VNFIFFILATKKQQLMKSLHSALLAIVFMFAFQPAFPKSVSKTSASSLPLEVITPLLKTKWGYGKPYNQSCPADSRSVSERLNGHCPAGCAAVAMAQLMKYWKWPLVGDSSKSYYGWEYGYIWAAFCKTEYHWDLMPDMVDEKTITTAQKDAVATLMYHCGVAAYMTYTAKESLCPFEYDPDKRPGIDCVEKAFVQYFRYKKSIKAIKGNYSDTAWTRIIREELAARRPVLYSGVYTIPGTTPPQELGHVLVIDGIDDQNRVHVNWGLYEDQKNNEWLPLSQVGFTPYKFTEQPCLLIGIEPDYTNVDNSQCVKTSISDNPESGNPLRIYPNPASDRLIVDFNTTPEEYGGFDILNSMGKKILSVAYSGSQVSIPLDNMTNGIYVIRFSNREKFITRKFVVKK
jgi:hypothetical protein